MKKLTIRFFRLVIVSLNFGGCRHLADAYDLQSTLKSYDRLILKTDADSIALLYAANGAVGNIAHGRNSLRKFLLRFKDYKVLERVSVIDSLHTALETGFISGSYGQNVIIPNINAIQFL